MATRLRSAEFVFPGHPDKLADAVADALVQEAGSHERRALAGVEVAVHRDRVFVTGRIACRGADAIDVASIARDVYRTAGYARDWAPAPEELRVDTDLCLGPLEDGEAESRGVADDQSICIGHAVAISGTNYLPLEQWLANRFGRRLAGLRAESPGLGVGPDGKILVVISESSDTSAWKVERISCSLQQRAGADEIALHRAVRHAIDDELQHLSRQLPGITAAMPRDVHVNAAGSFALGGPMGDNGLSGKKLVVDAYGPAVPIGGGALSGKDFFKVDRAGALHARRVAKAVVMTGAAREATVTLEWVPGSSGARILEIGCDGNRYLDPVPWSTLFDLSLESSGEAWTGGVDLIEVARSGHFTSRDLPWERLSISPARDRGERMAYDLSCRPAARS